MDIFPFERIVEKEKQIISEIIAKLPPLYSDSDEYSNKWVTSDSRILCKPETLEDFEECYLLYNKHPVHSYLDRLFVVSRENLIPLLQEKINTKKGEGIDIIISKKDLTKSIMCNHDGEVFLLI